MCAGITVVLACVPVLLLYWLVCQYYCCTDVTVVLASVPILLLYWLVCRYYCCTGLCAGITVVLSSVSVLLLYWLVSEVKLVRITVVLAMCSHKAGMS